MLEAARAFIERNTPSRSPAPTIFRRILSVVPLMKEVLRRPLLLDWRRYWTRDWVQARAGKGRAPPCRPRGPAPPPAPPPPLAPAHLSDRPATKTPRRQRQEHGDLLRHRGRLG